MKKSEIPKFKNEGEEADWLASSQGRAFVKQRSGGRASQIAGSNLVSQLRRKASVQIALRLPEDDLDRARKIASRKGIGYQTLLKMLVHEGLAREARRG